MEMRKEVDSILGSMPNAQIWSKTNGLSKEKDKKKSISLFSTPPPSSGID